MRRGMRRDVLMAEAGLVAGSGMLASTSLRAQSPMRDVAALNLPVEQDGNSRACRPAKFSSYGGADPAGELSCAIDDTPVFHAARSSEDEATRMIASKPCHAQPYGRPLGRLSERAPIINQAPECCACWLAAGVGYGSHPLQIHDHGDIGSGYPRRVAHESDPAGSLSDSHGGDVDEISAVGWTDRVLIDMVPSAAADDATPEQTARGAERRTNRYYEMHHG